MRHIARALIGIALCFLAGVAVAETADFPLRAAGVREILDTRNSGPTVAYRLHGNPDIFVLDIPDLARQGAMFNRVVALIERAGADRTRVFTDAELAAYIAETGRTPTTFTFGNDFRSSELTRFFNLAERDGIVLTPEERELKAFILRTGLLRTKYGFLQVRRPDRVILSTPRVHDQDIGDGRIIRVDAAAREAILRHEVGHGEYYTNRFYSDYCRRFWDTAMSEAERAAFRAFLGRRGYDTGNRELMINETQAYLMHTPFGGAVTPQALGLGAEQVADLRRRFLAGNPPTSLDLQR